jgi:phenylpropionate dioxygenase-like ring-hydroxylating dioxygenase large terminal subunit
MSDAEEAIRLWFPVSRCEEIVPRNVVQTELLGQEAALWRDDLGFVNAWENRCPHRGVRLSIGLNTGSELRCQYHGWRYASITGQCTYIPAHPGQKPPNVIKTKRYGCAEQYGFIWINLGDQPDAAAVPVLQLDSYTTMRSVFTQAPVDLVAQSLIEAHNFEPATSAGNYILETTGPGEKSVLLLQPMNAEQTVIHGLIPSLVRDADRLSVLRQFNGRVSEMRDAIERAAA